MTPALDHVGLTVSDLEASVAFYRDVVGMRELGSVAEIEGEWFDQLTDNRGARLRVAHLRLEGATLQLVEYTAAGGERLRLAHRHVGNPHLCIRVGDVDARHARLRAEGQHRVSPLVQIAETPLRSFYVTDPDGVLVELLEYPGA